VTVRDWIEQHTPRPPAALIARMLDMLGDDARRDASDAGALCLAAATRALDELVAAGRFGRDSALDLLAVDALTTFAFEHASGRAGSPRELLDLSDDGARRLGRLALQRV
jgi:hypothetical protein